MRRWREGRPGADTWFASCALLNMFVWKALVSTPRAQGEVVGTRKRIQAGGRDVVVIKNACGWKVEAGAARSSAHYLDDALVQVLPQLGRRDRERVVVDLLEWTHTRRLRLRAKQHAADAEPST
jgi:hypothetical protein